MLRPTETVNSESAARSATGLIHRRQVGHDRKPQLYLAATETRSDRRFRWNKVRIERPRAIAGHRDCQSTIVALADRKRAMSPNFDCETSVTAGHLNENAVGHSLQKALLMASETKIQWCDSAVNPIMGCGGCELFAKSPSGMFATIDKSLRALTGGDWPRGHAKILFRSLLNVAWQRLTKMVEGPGEGHVNRLTTTNVYHLRKVAESKVSELHGSRAGQAVRRIVEQSVTCYAAKLHANRGYSIVNPDRTVNEGYATTFEQVTQYEGRIAEAAKWTDLFIGHG